MNVNRQGGFTLLEALVALSLVAVVLLVIATTLLQGLKTYERLRFREREQAFGFCLEKLTRDLKNGARYSRIPWLLAPDTISFPTVVFPESSSDAVADARPVRVTYLRDDGNRLLRLQHAVPFDASLDRTEVLAQGAGSLRFSFTGGSAGEPPTFLSVEVFGADPSRPLLKRLVASPLHFHEARR